MKCVDIENYLSDYIADELESFNARKVELHLKDCHSCQKEADVFKETNQLLRNLPPIGASNKLDQRVMQSFRKHCQEKQKPAFWTAFFANFSVSKPALAFGLIALIAFTGAAFQLGRMTSPNTELSEKQPVTQSGETTEQNQIVKITEKRVEVPVIKTVEVPVYREKIINRVVYKDRTVLSAMRISDEKEVRGDKLNLRDTAVNYVRDGGSISASINLKDFQPVSEIKARIKKRGGENEY